MLRVLTVDLEIDYRSNINKRQTHVDFGSRGLTVIAAATYYVFFHNTIHTSIKELNVFL